MKNSIIKAIFIVAALCSTYLVKAQHPGGNNTNPPPGSNYIVTHTNTPFSGNNKVKPKTPPKGATGYTGNKAPVGSKGKSPTSSNPALNPKWTVEASVFCTGIFSLVV